MLSKISQFLQNLNQENSDEDEKFSLEVACTVLLCEVMRADDHLSDSEQKMLQTLISQHFSLQASEVKEIIEQAFEHSEQATDFYQFTSKINSHYSISQRMTIVELLWKIALADGKIASIEEHTIRRIADLLHLRHSEYIATKTQAISHQSD
ncbi:TerB family tellurite resistance protein [Thalassotalea sp. PLHSN55]|uniref:tellurite resistance TerB family protein n=1 Tax=Thalassotalea sp. PLHSN55 TaxID=3435888 RepID=UPI003F86D0EB